MTRPLAPARLGGIVALLLCSWLFSVCEGYNLVFNLDGRAESCMDEYIDASSKGTRLLFRFEVLTPRAADHLHFRILSPSGNEITSLKKVLHGDFREEITESGVHSFCFRRARSSKKGIEVFMDLKLIKTGMVVFKRVVSQDGLYEIEKGNLNRTYGNYFDVTGGKTAAIYRFNTGSIAKSAIKDTTRAYVRLSILDTKAESPRGGLTVVEHPESNEFSVEAMKSSLEGLSGATPLRTWPLQQNATISVDISSILQRALEMEQQYLTFAVLSFGGDTVQYSAKRGDSKKWATLLIEEEVDPVMRGITSFREKVFDLRTELAYRVFTERAHRTTVDSTNSRVLWMSFLINFVMVVVYCSQILYVKHMVDTS